MKPHPSLVVQPVAADIRFPSAGPLRDSDRSPARASKTGQSATGAALWSEFWQEFCLENEPQKRCYVPGDCRIVVDRQWAHFADGVPRGARVIDLGCGAGIAGRTLLNRRDDLHVTGVDWAEVPAMRAPNLEICPRVNMEALPFAEGSFDAAISLFGIEYANIDKTARQLERVLKPGARFSFLVHHQESQILREGRIRRNGLRELLSARMKTAFLTGNALDVERLWQSLAKQFAGERSVKLFSDYFRLHVTRSREERQAMWQWLADGLDPEIALLTCLEGSAKSAARMGAWLVPLLSVMSLIGVCTLQQAAGQPIAWDVHGIR